MPKKRGVGRTGKQAPAIAADAGARRPSAGRRRKATGRRRAGRNTGATAVKGRMGGRGLLAEARDMAQSVGETTLQTARGFAAGARDAAAGVADRTQNTASQVVGKVRDNRWPALLIGAGATWLAVDAIRDRVAESDKRGKRGRRRTSPVNKASRMASQAASTVAETGRGIGEQVEQFVRDNPLLAGAATLGLGVAVGMALPATMPENAMLGEARDAVVRKASEKARSTVKDIREIAERVRGRAER